MNRVEIQFEKIHRWHLLVRDLLELIDGSGTITACSTSVCAPVARVDAPPCAASETPGSNWLAADAAI